MKNRSNKNMLNLAWLGKSKRLLKCWWGSCPHCCSSQDAVFLGSAGGSLREAWLKDWKTQLIPLSLAP